MQKSRNVFVNNLKRFRTAKKLSQEKIAKKAGISRNAYRNIETGKTDPRMGNLNNIAAGLGVSIAQLMRVPPQLKSLRFRCHKAINNTQKSKRDILINDVAYWVENYNYLEDQLNKKPAFKLQNLIGAGRSPIEAAKKAREVLSLKPDEVINDICDLLENAGVKIYLFNQSITKFFGFSLNKEGNNPVICYKLYLKKT